MYEAGLNAREKAQEEYIQKPVYDNELDKSSVRARSARARLSVSCSLTKPGPEEYTASAKQLLDRGGFVVEPDGIWACGFNETGGLVNAEYFGWDKVTRPPEPRPASVFDDGESIHLDEEVDLWAFEHPAEARLKMMRDILQKFDVKVVASFDKIEVRGYIPTQIIGLPAKATGRKRGQDFNSASLITHPLCPTP